MISRYVQVHYYQHTFYKIPYNARCCPLCFGTVPHTLPHLCVCVCVRIFHAVDKSSNAHVYLSHTISYLYTYDNVSMDVCPCSAIVSIERVTLTQCLVPAVVVKNGITAKNPHCSQKNTKTNPIKS